MFLQLLPELQESVLRYCSIQDLRNLAQTNSKCNKLLKPFIFRTVSLRYKKVGKLFNELLKKYMKNYTKNLELDNCCIPAITFNNIATLENLHNLNLEGSNTNDSILLRICDGLSGLKVLNIGRTDVSDLGLDYIRKLLLLEELNLYACYVTDVGMAHISMLPVLKRLDVSCTRISDEGLAHLSLLPTLEELTLQNLNQITEAGFCHVATMATLTFLDVSACDISEKSLALIVDNVPLLKELDIRFCEYLSKKIVKYYKKNARFVVISKSELSAEMAKFWSQ